MENNATNSASQPSLNRLLHRYPTAVFFGLTLFLSWGWWAVAYFHIADGELTDALALPGAFGPPVAAALLTWVLNDDLRAWAAQIVDWRVSVHWYVVAIMLPLVITVGGVGSALLLTGAPLDLFLLAQRLPVFPFLLLFTLLLGGGQEEPGWRGFALPRLQASFSGFVASLIVGLVWAVWHLPLFLMGATRNQTGSFLLYTLLILGVSVIVSWCYNETDGSVLLAMLLHAAVNTSGSLLPIQQDTAAQWALVIDVSSIIAVWMGVVAVLRWGSAATLSRNGIPDPSAAGIETD